MLLGPCMFKVVHGLVGVVIWGGVFTYLGVVSRGSGLIPYPSSPSLLSKCLSTSQERAPPPPKCVDVVRLVVVFRGRDKVPMKVTSSSESEGLRVFKRFRKVQHKG